MEKKSQFEITPEEIYIVVSVVIFLLIAYFGYIILLKDNNNSNSEGKIVYFNTSENKKTEDLSDCDSLEGSIKSSCIIKNKVCKNDDCFYNQARIKQDENECFNIKDEVLKVTCTSSIKYDTIIQGAVLEDNVAMCDTLEGSEVILGCYDNYYFAKAINTQDKSYCEKIANLGVKNECIK